MERDSDGELSRFLKRVQWVVVLAVILWLLMELGTVLIPFVIALLFGWMGDPIVDWLERRGYSRTLGVVAVYVVAMSILIIGVLVLVPLVERQIQTLIDSLPMYQAWIMETAIPWIEARLDVEISPWLDPQQLTELVRDHWQQAGGVATTTFGYLSRSGFVFLTWVVYLILIPILSFYFLRDWDLLVARVAALIPRNHIETVSALARDTDEVLGGFLRGQFLVMVAQGTFYAIGLQLIGLKLGILLGIVAGLISFIPWVGATVGAVLMLVAALVQEQGFNWQLLILGSLVFAAGQLIESYVLTPRLVGDRIGLHPVAVIFAVMAGGALFGFLGMLLALPVASVANVLLTHARVRYQQSQAYAGDASKSVIVETSGLITTDDDRNGPKQQ